MIHYPCALSARLALALAALALALPLLAGGAPAPKNGFLLRHGQRVVFLGDSNTFDGKFIAYLDAYLCTRFPTQRFELINLGLPSETCCGLSEPDHPYPRPDVQERAERALAMTKPNVVVICYGMNDGIYSPFSEERFGKYQQGILKLVAQVQKAGATPILMTPAPFDASPLKDRVQEGDAAKFSWLRPYRRYDEDVLKRYANWLMTLRERKLTVIDAHAALLRHLAVMRQENADYHISGDGIHPSANGHLVIAMEILKEWHAPASVMDVAIDVSQNPPTRSNVKVHQVQRNAVAFSLALHQPMPADPAWTPRAREVEQFDRCVNHYSLKVKGMQGALAIRLDKGKRMQVAADKLARGINPAARQELRSESVETATWKLIAEKNRLLGLAWLTAVGHKRPDTPKGIPLEEAKTKAAMLDAAIRRRCASKEVTISIGPLGK